jgi:hypothetical protein
MIVTDLYNMIVISHKDFIGHFTLAGHSIKILAYANDTVHLSTLTDIRIYKLLLRQYILATKKGPTRLGIKVVKATKYLEVITRDDRKREGKTNKTRAILIINYGREENETCYGRTRTRNAGTAQKVWSCPTHLHQKGEWVSPFSQ